MPKALSSPASGCGSSIQTRPCSRSAFDEREQCLMQFKIRIQTLANKRGGIMEQDHGLASRNQINGFIISIECKTRTHNTKSEEKEVLSGYYYCYLQKNRRRRKDCCSKLPDTFQMFLCKLYQTSYEE
ncbi:uncharacterized protein A4U43_C10F3520 [Asparagus officinalis]|uniref:Uncharacterized protein n=1 Tax=Asparagus officinalis TaxID=4686 RepID=A0A5P1E0C8_ASPOF|nr:uncharacterized protein LOC109826177 [Asparagus officinalis]ONK56040.1 uncharacterized protein A4U43_C10F3520 [Asparagus officinalis]